MNLSPLIVSENFRDTLTKAGLVIDGEIIADGTFESLKQTHDDTLERIFSKLTGREDSGSETDAIINALD